MRDAGELLSPHRSPSELEFRSGPVVRRGAAQLGSVRLGAAEWWRWSISFLVFHRFQSIKLVALVLPPADHAGAVPFFCIAAISVVFRVFLLSALPFLYSRSGWSTVEGCNPPACSGENNARKAFVASGKGKDSARNFAGASATRKNSTGGTIELILYTSLPQWASRLPRLYI